MGGQTPTLLQIKAVVTVPEKAAKHHQVNMNQVDLLRLRIGLSLHALRNNVSVLDNS